MTNPWKVAEATMTDYFASKGQEWPAIEADQILSRVGINRDHRWTNHQLVDQAQAVLSRATFSMDELVKDHLKISMSYECLDYLDESQGSKVYGCAYPQSREIVICTRTLGYKPLFRTTVAHELGHVLMHTDVQQRCLLYTERSGSSSEEREANAFMKAIILPKPTLDLAITYICDTYGIDVRLAFGSANSIRGRDVWSRCLFVPLINKLCVSRDMVCISMKQRGVFSEETVAYHKTYALKTHWNTPRREGGFMRVMRHTRQNVTSVAKRRMPA